MTTTTAPELTDKQRRFVEEYLVDLNATQAAIRAGYSEATAYSIGSENLRKPEIMAAVDAAMVKLRERSGIEALRVVREFEKIAFADPRAVMTWGPDGVILRDSASLTDADAAIVSEVAQTKDGLRIKLNSKLVALSELGKHLGVFKERVEHTGANGGPIQIEHKDLTPNDIARRVAWLLHKAAKRAAAKPKDEDAAD